MTFSMCSRVISSVVAMTHNSPAPLVYSNHASIKKCQGVRP